MPSFQTLSLKVVLSFQASLTKEGIDIFFLLTQMKINDDPDISRVARTN